MNPFKISKSDGRKYFAELAGTFVLCFFGLGSLHAGVLAEAHAGLWQIAVIWSLGISLAIYSTAAISGAHLNPAITIAFAAFGGFEKRRVVPYIASQVLGAFAAAAVLYWMFSGLIAEYEAANSIVRGGAGSHMSAMVYAEYFPNPGMAKALGWSPESVPMAAAMFGEAIGTAFLAFFIFALTDSRNGASPGSAFAPVMIGLGVGVLISVISPLTQAGFNPARDFGPRLFAWMCGWGSEAIPGPRGGFFAVYVLSPVAGALAGAFAYGILKGKNEKEG